MVCPAVGNHGITMKGIFNLVAGIFTDKFTMRVSDDYAGKLLYISQGISIKDNMFTQVRLGTDVNVLIVEEYLGSKFRDYVYDVAMVNNTVTFFIFSDSLTNEKVPRSVRAARIYGLFEALVMLYAKTEIINVLGSMYSTMVYYAPMVMTVRLINRVSDTLFDYDEDYDPTEYTQYVNDWFTRDAYDAIMNTKNTDADLLEFGLLVEHVSSTTNQI